MVSLGFNFRLGFDSGVFLFSTPAPVIADPTTTNGLMENGEFLLTDERTGMLASEYTSGESFRVGTDGIIHFSGTLDAGVYNMQWEDKTLATTSGYVKAKEFVFAGGIAGEIVMPGFIVQQSELLAGGEIYDQNSSSSYIYRTVANTETILTTGARSDVIVADEGTVNVFYSRVQANAGDLILGFGNDDRITISQQAASMLEKNFNDKLDWAAQADIAVATATTEAVSISIDGPFLFPELNDSYSDTLNMLNARIDLEQLGAGESLLILAKNELDGAAVLLFYTDSDGKA